MADIFVSYAREDEARVQALVSAFQAQGWSVFWDRSIPAGSTWRSHIGAALDEARCIVVLWSQHSVRSDWVSEEADEGKRRRILIPVIVDGVQPPRGFREVQAADLSDWQPGVPSDRFKRLCLDMSELLRAGAGPAVPAGPARTESPDESSTASSAAVPAAAIASPAAFPGAPSRPASREPTPRSSAVAAPREASETIARSTAAPAADAGEVRAARPPRTMLAAGALVALVLVGGVVYSSLGPSRSVEPEETPSPASGAPDTPAPIVVPEKPETSGPTVVTTPQWLVVAGTYRPNESSTAQRRRQALVDAGHDAVTIETNDYPMLAPGLVAVVVGPFGSRGEANAALAVVRSSVRDAYVKQGR
jgi:hypothetical protein